MKIAFVSEHYPSKEHTQYCVYLQQQALALQGLGHDVEIIRLQKGDKSCGIEIIAGLNVYNVVITNRYVDKIYASYKHRLRGKVNWALYDIVSIHIVSVPFAECVIDECLSINVPSVFHFHGLNVWNDYYHKTNIIYNIRHAIDNRRKLRFLRKCHAIVGVSKGVCDVVHEYVREPKTYLVYNGVDITKFPRTTRSNITNSVFKIICVANFIPIKGQEYLIKAVAQIVAQGIGIHLNLIGQGPDEEKLRNLVVRFNLQEYVTFLGLQSYEDVYHYMSQSDMFIMPSYYDSFGCVYVEAMSTGLVTCGCNVYGPQEIINDGVDGILVKPKDVQSIVDAIKKTYFDTNFRKKLEDNAVKRAEHFSWEESAKALENVYKKVLGK